MSDKNDNLNSLTENNKDKSEEKEENENIEDENIQESEKNKNNLSKYPNKLDSIPFTILKEDYPVYDLSFKIIIIGNSGKYIFILIQNI